ncbi:MAG: sensor histidine kinase [Acidimicrobiales bacterium]
MSPEPVEAPPPNGKPRAMSIRLRLALTYSGVLCVLAGLVILAIYLALAHAVDSQPVVTKTIITEDGRVLGQETFQSVERVVNAATLEKLRTYSVAALMIFFVASFGVSYWIAGYLLRPIGRITRVARDISATDLTRRIDLQGPDDELHELADTFDDMLGRLDEAFANQRQFIQEASHELRNPLAVIRTNLEVTLTDPEASPDDLRHTAEVVERSTDRMTRLVDDLLLYARNETPALEHETVDAATLVHEAADEFRAPAEARGLAIAWDASPGLLVAGDRNALRQALANLLANATRLAPTGTEVRVRAGREGPWIWLAVDDQGPGIAPEDQDRIFQRFWRGDAERAGAEKRSGLGLTIVRQIVEAHGGEVKLVSALGHGSTFAIWLPALVTAPAPAGPPADGSPPAGPAAAASPNEAPQPPTGADPVHRTF